MNRLLALLLVVGVTYLITSRVPPPGFAARGTGLALGFTLIAAALAGEIFGRLRLPRITGYLLFGMLCGPYLGEIINSAMARELQFVNGVAIALIAFVAGTEFNLQRLRPRLRAMLEMGAVIILLMWIGLWAVYWAAWPWLPLVPEADALQRLALSALLSTVTVTFSPTVTIAVIAESRARGPLAELVLAVVILGDLMLIVLFTLSSEAVRWSLGEAPLAGAGIVSGLAWEIFGSLAFGALVGSIFALYLRGVGREVTVVLLGVCALLSQLGSALHFEPLLAALAAGLVVENIAPPQGDALRDAVERGALPVLVIFFAAAGANLHLAALAEIGLLAIGVSALRLAFIRLGTHLGCRAAGLDSPQARMVWMGLVSQAGVTLGLAILVASEFPGWGEQLATLTVALIALHEMVGPILFRSALARAGEIGKMDEHVPAPRARDGAGEAEAPAQA
ncbi:MAG: transporter [Luteitalea sp.]|nr:transporter [Luteitalea sp.]